VFDDLFNLVRQFEHDYREENGKRVHAYGCRRCALTTRLSAFKIQITQLLRDLDIAIGEYIEKNKQP